MLTIYIYAFISVIIVSFVSFVGVFSLTLKDDFVKKYIGLFISLAVGALLGDSFIHLIPETFEKSSGPTLTGLLIIIGILIFFILEKFLHWHHHGEDKDEPDIHPVGKLLLFTDGFHNFIDGIIIGVSFLVSIPVGIATTLAVILHEIPQEVGDFAVLLHSGYEKKRALWLNFLSALTAVAGTIIALIFGNIAETFTIWILPIAAGGFIYIAMADLIPELHKTKEAKYSVLQILSVFIGIALMLALLLLE
ncbi:ZIP family metal transporter [Candidatus Nomurabacteria bacterium CG_4_10_14_0_2_um_filter_30_12]|uniref:ZIP family metal transporter n=2 Tax=Candidatus Nomuraibacteriota TaxID=1752729 RepID=A0A2J0MFG0_9BACT|nr:MAG: ZIP family metal transporter [Candidatus Nomurabacteria bacterium CG10_big_fil_rev_8_21_14_0_10_03_31_7]PIZ87059.1 MAG: ZIP family metal transporter [Candidatus Nomurabacteria bacterium CG_4_10_14_0_2_um_filter_30_12]